MGPPDATSRRSRAGRTLILAGGAAVLIALCAGAYVLLLRGGSPPVHRPEALGTPRARLPQAPSESPAFQTARRRQEDAARSLGVPVRTTLDLGGGAKMDFVLIPPSKDGSTPAFYVGATEVTQGQYAIVMGKTPFMFPDAANPAEMVSWHDAVRFCGRTAQHAGKALRLPTAAEWRQAAGADGTAAALAGHWPGAADGPAAAGSSAANAWGVCEGYGNVWEWCADEFGQDAPTFRAVCGRSWRDWRELPLPLDRRYGCPPDQRNGNLGFRAALDIEKLGTHPSFLAAGPTPSSTRPKSPTASSPVLERLLLTIDDGVPYQPTGGNVERRDLQVELTRAAGSDRVDPNGWAWCDAMSGLDWPVAVTACDANASRMHLVLDMTLGHYPPAYVGGRVSYTLDLERSFQTLRGAYRGEIRSIAGRKKPTRSELLVRRREAPAATVGQIVPGQVASVLDVAEARYRVYRPITAHGVIHPCAAPVAAAPSGHPRLLFGRDDVAAVRAGFATPDVAVLAFEMLASLEKSDPRAPGQAAAAQALCTTFLGRDPAAAAAAARQAVRLLAERKHDPGIAKELAGLALAYDLCCDDWQADLRAEVRAALLAAARRICAVAPEPRPEDAIFGEGKLAGVPAGPYDYRLGMLRAAAGLAWLATAGDGGSGPTDAAIPHVLRRSIERLLATGIGQSGAGTGSYELAELVKLLYPFCQAWRRATGDDPAAGTGAEQLPLYGAFTRGLCFDRGSGYAAGPWMAIALPSLPRPRRPVALWHLARYGCRADDVWSAAVAAINMPASLGAAAPPGESLRPAWHDRRMGSVAFRSGWDDRRDFVVTLEAASGCQEAAEMRGDLSVSGLGRQWLSRFDATGIASPWPTFEQRNVLQLPPNTTQKAGPLRPDARGYVEVIRVRPDGSAASAAVRADAGGGGLDCLHPPRAIFRVSGLDGEEARKQTPVEASAWRTVGADFSGASGADALIAIVEGTRRTRPWLRAWEIDVGDLPPQAVQCGPTWFVVRPPGSRASMKGTFLYPDGVVDKVASVAYLPPAGGLGGRIRAMLDKPDKVIRPVLELEGPRKGDEMLEALRDLAGPGAAGRAGEQAADDETDEQGVPRKGARHELLGSVMFNLLRKQTSSVQMGGGDRWGKAEGSCVVVLTIQRGEPPPVTPAKDPDGWLCKVGGQTVWYREYLFEFEKKP